MHHAQEALAVAHREPLLLAEEDADRLCGRAAQVLPASLGAGKVRETAIVHKARMRRMSACWNSAQDK